MKKKPLTKKEKLIHFINEASELHGGKYNYDKFIFINKTTKGIIICPIHGEFEQSIKSHLKKCGCLSCGRARTKRSHSHTVNEFINIVNNIHENKYDYSKFIYNGSNIKGVIICKLHGEFSITPSAHISQKQGCKICGIEKARQSRLSNIVEFIEKANIIHNNKFTYDNFNYINSHTAGLITCSIHGDFPQCPDSHLHGRGCGWCSKKKANINTFLKKSHDKHGDRYTYQNFIYIDCKTKSFITCKKHGDFLQNANNHQQGKGCPDCSSNISKMEIEWLNSLGIKIRGKRIKIFDKLYKVDGYDPITNTIYEFNGDFWHGNPNFYSKDHINERNNETFGFLYDKTMEKESNLKKAGYNIISIWEEDYIKCKKS